MVMRWFSFTETNPSPLEIHQGYLTDIEWEAMHQEYVSFFIKYCALFFHATPQI